MKIRRWNTYPESVFGVGFEWTHNLRLRHGDYAPEERWVLYIDIGRLRVEVTGAACKEPREEA